jgi:hypothetical protein
MDIDTGWLGRASLLRHLIYQLLQVEGGRADCLKQRRGPSSRASRRPACDDCIKQQVVLWFATMEKLFRSAI